MWVPKYTFSFHTQAVLFWPISFQTFYYVFDVINIRINSVKKNGLADKFSRRCLHLHSSLNTWVNVGHGLSSVWLGTSHEPQGLYLVSHLRIVLILANPNLSVLLIRVSCHSIDAIKFASVAFSCIYCNIWALNGFLVSVRTYLCMSVHNAVTCRHSIPSSFSCKVSQYFWFWYLVEVERLRLLSWRQWKPATPCELSATVFIIVPQSLQQRWVQDTLCAIDDFF